MKNPIAFRSATVERELLRRTDAQGVSRLAKADLLVFYAVCQQVLRDHPQKLVGAIHILNHYRRHGSTITKVGTVPGFAYDVACSRMEGITKPTEGNFIDAGFRIV